MSAISTDSGWLACRYSALARITASGVRSSCDASATNACWRSNASRTGASAFPARNQPPIAATNTLATPPTSSTIKSLFSDCCSGRVERATCTTANTPWESATGSE